MSLEFFAAGVPISKGSMRGFTRGGRVHLTNNSEKTKPWQILVGNVAHSEMKKQRICAFDIGPISVTVTFFMPRPNGHFRKSGELKQSAPEFCGNRPDIDKLVRTLLDALTGVAWRDDSQVVELIAVKRYVYAGGASGIRVCVGAICAS